MYIDGSSGYSDRMIDELQGKLHLAQSLYSSTTLGH